LKNSLSVLTAILLGLSCEDFIDLDLPTSEPRLVIDALLGFNENNGNPITAGQVKLTLTAPFLDKNVPPAQDATVSIIDNLTGQSTALQESSPGIFNLVELPRLQFGKDYTLRVHYNGEVYSATQQLHASTLIENLEQSDGFLFDEEETEVKVTFTDIPNERNHYLFLFGFDNFLVIEDEFFQDSQLTFSYFYEDLGPGDLLTVALFGIDQDFANYVNLTLTQSGEEDGGDPFATPPATVRGNITNTTNPNNYPFGYFALGEFHTKTLTIE